MVSHCMALTLSVKVDFHHRTRVDEKEAMYERPRVNVKVERGLTFTLRVTFHTLSVFYLRP